MQPTVKKFSSSDILTSLEVGASIIKEVVKTLPNRPGVYRMISASSKVLYVGKAKNLKKRVISYSHVDKLPNRLKRMVSETLTMEIVTTSTEIEALLLESNLIKKLQPKYNVLLKDDKSFPYVLLTAHDYPRILKHRGPKTEKGTYFGPFANVAAVEETILTMQRLFQVRNCSDNNFQNRDRPCLQYHIKRCTAPCVGKISMGEYNESVQSTKAFLNGKSDTVQRQLAVKMHKASEELDFERAAQYRDSIRLLTKIQARQRINVAGIEHADVFSLAQLSGCTVVQGFFFRHGRNYGTEVFELAHTDGATQEEQMAAFLSQFYVEHEPPAMVLCNLVPDDIEILNQSFRQQYGVKVTIEHPQNGVKRDLVEHAFKNAKEHLERRYNAELTHQKQFGLLQEFLNIPTIDSIEVYDNSHLQGSSAYGVLICATRKGFEKSRYRKFSIREMKPDFGGDDIAMMREVMKRRLSYKDEWPLPDLLLIDGGQAQVNAVTTILDECNIKLPVVGIAKGAVRNAGDETFYFSQQPPSKLPKDSPLLYFLQVIRDEAHRFAIGTHRAGRQKSLVKSQLDEIPGIGAKRKKMLLQHFGSAAGVGRASIEDLMTVSGISRKVAEKIYYFFHQR
jgi:excinuclease ABC subunit C